MKPATFPEQTVIIAKDQPEYQPLPSFQYFDPKGTVVFCWQLNWQERFTLLFTGKLWHYVLTFNKHLQPQLLSTKKPQFSLKDCP